MNKKTSLILAFLLLIFAIVAVSIHLGQVRSGSSDELRIGAILPLSGEFAEEGQKALCAIRMAEDRNNADAGKKPMRVLVEDGKFTGKDSASAFQKLSLQKLDAVISFGTPCTGAIRDMVRRAEIPMMALDGTASEDKDNPWSFICIHSVRQVGEAMARYAGQFIENAPVAVLYMKDSSGDEFLRGFRSAWQGTAFTVESYGHDATDTKSIVSKTLEQQPGLVCVFGYGIGYVSVLNSLLDAGFGKPILTDMNITSALGKLKDNGRGIQFVSLDYGPASPNESSHRFISDMESRCGLTPSVFSAFAYEAVNMLALDSGTMPPYPLVLKNRLDNLQDFPSVVGRLSYDGNRELIIPFNIYRLTDDGAEEFVVSLN